MSSLSFEGKNQSLYPPSVNTSQRYATILVSEHSKSISAVFCYPISIPSIFAITFILKN